VNRARELIEKIRGLRVGDYVKVFLHRRKTPVYGEVIAEVDWEGKKLYSIYLDSNRYLLADPKTMDIRLSQRRKK